MKIGYARVSTQDQNLSLQIEALKLAGCEKIYQEKKSGSKTDRPELLKLIQDVRKDDTVIVWKLDRLGRSLPHLIETVKQFSIIGANFVSLKETIDTTTATGKLIFNVFASLAEFERDMIRERTNAGLQSARERGKVGGRPKGLSDKAQATAKTAKILYTDKSMSVDSICNQLKIGRATLYRYLRSAGVEINKPNY